ncbi:type VII secretion target [Nocardia sp. NPDC050697]|uniref:type VII secretion target n=1 Tax=Nocardia sp. NPDC050697 TaxID=3155158 RepID=UPI00340209D9
MGHELHVELAELEKVSQAWLQEVAPELQRAAKSIDALKYTQVQFGPLFIGAWSSYSKAAKYIQDRLNEAVPAAEQVGNALHAAAASFANTEAEQADGLNRVPSGENSRPS